jgi:hypothetical protein
MSANWIDANQALLVAEFARIRMQLNSVDSTQAIDELATLRAEMPAPGAIDVLVDCFALTPFERDILLLCAGLEMDGAMATQCGGATFSLAIARLHEPHWSALTPARPLRRWRLIEVRDERALTSGRLTIDERILHFLAGINAPDSRLSGVIRERAESGLLAESHAATAEAVAASIERSDRPLLQLCGDDVESQLEVARLSAARSGLSLYVLPAADIPSDRHEADALALLWSREALLLPAALCIEDAHANPASAAALIRNVSGVVYLTGRAPLAAANATGVFEVDRPAVREQKQLWSRALGKRAAQFNGTLDAIATQFRLGTATIARTARALRADDDAPHSGAEKLWRACRESVRTDIEGLAQRIEPAATWHDLVLPEPQLATLRQIGAHARNRMKVYEEWGFAAKSSRGLGISTLFCGESGTGKTMAAEVLANELHLDLFRIDLALMVSKYIGETEKNLRKVFDAAEQSGAILLFDEADALFGKRSEVKEGRDRYANIEVSYLLQRMEAYRGLAILTTNLKGAIDVAFHRRLRFVVQFPFPDQSQRERIWRGVFPDGVPLGDIAHAKLARLNVAGGHIRNIALNAAFLAAESDQPLGMAHLLQSARTEALKRERPYSDAETRGWG